MKQTSPNIKFLGKAQLMKELQRTISFRAYNDVVCRGTSSSADNLKKMASEKYHGKPNDEDSVGYAKQMLAGFGMFSPMFERSDQIITAPGGGNADEIVVTLTMKQLFHCTHETIIVSKKVGDQGISLPVLTANKMSDRSNLKARTIWSNGRKVETNGRKALALIQRSDYKDGKLPSGTTYDDYLYWLRSSMYLELKQNMGGEEEDTAGNTSIDDDDDEAEGGNKDDDAGSADVMPDNWYFPGFIAFALWGAIMPEDMDDDYRAKAFLLSDDPKKSKADGRAAIRKEQKDENSSGTKTTSDKHARSMFNASPITSPDGGNSNQQLFAASIAQQTMWTNAFKEGKRVDQRMMLLLKAQDAAEKDILRFEKLCTPEMFHNPHLHENNRILQAYWKAVDKKDGIDTELAQLRQTLMDNSASQQEDNYQCFIDNILDAHMPQSPKKRARHNDSL